MTAPDRVVLLPGAGGDGAFWAPVAERLPAAWDTVRVSWPGLGHQPPDPRIRGFDDLVALAEGALAAGGDLVAQSLGGVVAARIAARHPERVRRLVLVATSGGLDLAPHGAADWRPDYRRAFPAAAPWIADPVPAEPSQFAAIAAPTLLIWGDRDPISPVSIGRALAALIPDARLEVVAGGTHDLVSEQPDTVAALIAAHLA